MNPMSAAIKARRMGPSPEGHPGMSHGDQAQDPHAHLAGIVDGLDDVGKQKLMQLLEADLGEGSPEEEASESPGDEKIEDDAGQLKQSSGEQAELQGPAVMNAQVADALGDDSRYGGDSAPTKPRNLMERVRMNIAKTKKK